MAFSSTSLACRIQTPSSAPQHKSRRTSLFMLRSALSSRASSISCVLTDKPQQKGDEKRTVNGHGCDILQTPDSFGRFGKFGGRYVPETVLFALADLELAFNALSSDLDFQKELDGLLKDYVGRESPLYFAERLSEHYKRPNGEGPLIYLKREDLNHTGAHKINNAVAQALLAKRLGKERIIAEIGAGQHGVISTDYADDNPDIYFSVFQSNIG